MFNSPHQARADTPTELPLHSEWSEKGATAAQHQPSPTALRNPVAASSQHTHPLLAVAVQQETVPAI